MNLPSLFDPYPDAEHEPFTELPPEDSLDQDPAQLEQDNREPVTALRSRIAAAWPMR